MTPETEFDKNWLAKQYHRIQLDFARIARKQWLKAKPWAREQVLREERDGKEEEPTEAAQAQLVESAEYWAEQYERLFLERYEEHAELTSQREENVSLRAFRDALEPGEWQLLAMDVEITYESKPAAVARAKLAKALEATKVS